MIQLHSMINDVKAAFQCNVVPWHQKQKHKGNIDFNQCRECYAQKRRLPPMHQRMKRNLYESMETGRRRAFQAHAEMLDNLPERCREEGSELRGDVNSAAQIPSDVSLDVATQKDRTAADWGLDKSATQYTFPLIAIFIVFVLTLWLL